MDSRAHNTARDQGRWVRIISLERKITREAVMGPTALGSAGVITAGEITVAVGAVITGVIEFGF